MFGKIIHSFEKHSKSYQSQKRPSNTEQMNRAQIIRIEVWKH